MISIYTTDKEKLNKEKVITKGCWVDVVNPTAEELNYVARNTNTDEDLLLKLLDSEELPRIEKRETCTLIVVDMPYVNDSRYRYKYTTEPLGIIINDIDGYLITISLKSLVVLEDFRNNNVKEFSTSNKTKFVLQLLLKVAALYQKELKDINKYIGSKEKILYKATNNKELIDLLNIEKTLVYFSTSLKANDVVLEKLSKGNVIKQYDNDVDILEDAIIENKQAIEMCTIYREILSSMTDTYATIISNNLNDGMKFLASITIVFSIPTMVASFLGMNVPLGTLASSKISFLIIIGISVILACIIAYILKKKNLL